MKTRSMSKVCGLEPIDQEPIDQEPIDQEDHLYPVIDFDEASRCWTENKIKLTNGTYKYKKIKRNLFRRGHKK